MSTKKTMVLFALLEGFFWSVSASFLSYFAAFGLSKGFEESLVSVMIAAYLVSAFAGQFFWGSLCDRLRTNKKVFMGCLLLVGIGQILLYYTHHIVLFLLLYCAMGFLYGPLGSILDTWMLRNMHYDMKTYGVSRGFGSAGYAVTIYITGRLIAAYGYRVMPVLSTTFAVIAILLSCLVPDSVVQQSTASKGTISMRDVLTILRIPAYLMILAIMFFVGLSNSPVNNLKIVILQEVGGDVSTQGIDAFIGCMVQFLFFFIMGYLAAFPAKQRMFFATVSMLLAMFINFHAQTCSIVIIGTIFMNVTYSLLMASSRELIFQVVKPEYQTTANGLSDAAYSFIAGTIAMLYAGSLAEQAGVHIMIGLCLCISLIPVMLALLQLRKGGQRRCCRHKRVAL